MSGWIIGEVELVKAPNKITKKRTFAYKKTSPMIEQPWLISMGPDLTQLAFEGQIFEGSKSLTTMYNSYISKLESYLERKNGPIFPLINPAAPTKGWSSGAGVTTFTSNSNTYVKPNHSAQIVFHSGEIYKDFSANTDFSLFNLASMWAKRSAAGGKLQITFYNEPYATRTNGYRFYASGGTSWAQKFVATTGSDYSSHISNTVGTPTGWNKIRSTVIEISGAVGDSNTWYLDAFFTSIGFWITTPKGFYDGIYALNDFQFEEEGGNIASFSYKINMSDQTQLYGRSKDAV